MSRAFGDLSGLHFERRLQCTDIRLPRAVWPVLGVREQHRLLGADAALQWAVGVVCGLSEHRLPWRPNLQLEFGAM